MCTTRRVQGVDGRHLRRENRFSYSPSQIVKPGDFIDSFLTRQTVTACTLAVWMLLAHVDLERLLIFVVPIALRTFERLAGVARRYLHAAVEASGI